MEFSNVAWGYGKMHMPLCLGITKFLEVEFRVEVRPRQRWENMKENIHVTDSRALCVDMARRTDWWSCCLQYVTKEATEKRRVCMRIHVCDSDLCSTNNRNISRRCPSLPSLAMPICGETCACAPVSFLVAHDCACAPIGVGNAHMYVSADHFQ